MNRAYGTRLNLETLILNQSQLLYNLCSIISIILITLSYALNEIDPTTPCGALIYHKLRAQNLELQ
jgi:hypothetical protein